MFKQGKFSSEKPPKVSQLLRSQVVDETPRHEGEKIPSRLRCREIPGRDYQPDFETSTR